MPTPPKISTVPFTPLGPLRRVCPHADCQTLMMSHGRQVLIGSTFIQAWNCLACLKDTVSIASPLATGDGLREALSGPRPDAFRQIVPASGAKAKSFRACPGEVLEPYTVAANLVSIYPPASAAMSRKAIERLLHRQGYEQRQLTDKLKALANETEPNKKVSVRLIGFLAAMREFGNLGLHPIKSAATAEIVEVEAGEADLCLSFAEELIEELCDRPVIEAELSAKTAARLRDAGKGAAADMLMPASPKP